MRAVYLLSFVSLFLSVLANPHPGGRNARGFTPSTTVEARDMTNAERLSRGLNLKAPVRRGERRHPRPSSTPNTNKDGNIKVYKTSGNNFLGYLMLDDGRFGLASRARDALEFDFTVPSGSGVTSGIRIKGGDGNNKFLSLIQPNTGTQPSLSTSSANYLLMGLSSGTAPGAIPTVVNWNSVASNLKVESDIWTYNPTNDRISPDWVNPDGSHPTVECWESDETIYCGGSRTKWRTANGNRDADPVYFVLDD